MFVHYTATQGEGYKSMKEGDEVAFEIIQGEEGPQADKVTPWKPTRCSPVPLRKPSTRRLVGWEPSVIRRCLVYFEPKIG